MGSRLCTIKDANSVAARTNNQTLSIDMPFILNNRHLRSFYLPLQYEQSTAIWTRKRPFFFLLELTPTQTGKDKYRCA